MPSDLLLKYMIPVANNNNYCTSFFIDFFPLLSMSIILYKSTIRVMIVIVLID